MCSEVDRTHICSNCGNTPDVLIRGYRGFVESTVIAGGRGAGSGEQGRDWDTACTPPQSKRPRSGALSSSTGSLYHLPKLKGLDSYVALCSTARGKGLLPLLPAPFPPLLLRSISLKFTFVNLLTIDH